MRWRGERGGIIGRLGAGGSWIDGKVFCHGRRHYVSLELLKFSQRSIPATLVSSTPFYSSCFIKLK